MSESVFSNSACTYLLLNRTVPTPLIIFARMPGFQEVAHPALPS